MKKYLLLFITAMTILLSSNCYTYADTIDADFDESSIIVVMNPQNTHIRTFSSNSCFDGLGISKIENLNPTPSNEISLFSTDTEETVLKLTLSVTGKENVLETIDALNEMSEVKYAEPNYIYYLSNTVNDSYYSRQYALGIVGAENVWNMNIDCSDITVAIIDSGVTTTHTDLADNIWTNPKEIAGDGIDNDGNGFIDDIHGWDFVSNSNDITDVLGHGTHVAGIVGSVTNNRTGVASLARNPKILSIKVFDDEGATSAEYLYKAVIYAKRMNIPIVNASFGGFTKTQSIETAIQSCTNTLFLAAAGNAANDNPPTNNDIYPLYPANYNSENILSIASSDQNDQISTFSNYGTATVDIAAPGTAIYSTTLKNGYTYMNGTSMSCPLVASAAVVVKAKYPDMTPTEIADKLISSADTVPSLSRYVRDGKRLNAYEALRIHARNITLDKSSLTLRKNETTSISASISPTNTTDLLSWESSNEAVAVVDDNGSITAIGKGTANITAVCGNITSFCSVTVLNPSSVPIPSTNYVTALRSGNTVNMDITLPDTIDDSELFVYAVIKENGVLKSVTMPSVSNRSAEFEIPEGMENMDISIYVWDEYNNPFTHTTYVE